jgi:hypothetical protein
VCWGGSSGHASSPLTALVPILYHFLAMTIPHEVNGKRYEIRVIEVQNGFEVRTHRDDGKQIGVTYSATHESAHFFNVTGAALTGQSAMATLVKLAKDDLDNGATK